MSPEVTYRQVELRNGTRFQYAWIPSTFARVGKALRIKDEEGWVVTQLGHSATQTWLKKRERDHLHQREVSDI